MTRVGLRKKREEATTAPAMDCGLIPDLLDCVVDNRPVPKVPMLSNKSAPLVSGTAMKNVKFPAYLLDMIF